MRNRLERSRLHKCGIKALRHFEWHIRDSTYMHKHARCWQSVTVPGRCVAAVKQMQNLKKIDASKRPIDLRGSLRLADAKRAPTELACRA
jgi:hypothetical protein